MWESLDSVLTALPPTMKAISALLGAAAAGALGMAGVGGWWGLPASDAAQTELIEANKVAITVVSDSLATGSAQRARILCLVELQLGDDEPTAREVSECR